MFNYVKFLPDSSQIARESSDLQVLFVHNGPFDPKDLLVFLLLLDVMLADDYSKLVQVFEGSLVRDHTMPCGQDPFPVNDRSGTGRLTVASINNSGGGGKFMRFGFFTTHNFTFDLQL